MVSLPWNLPFFPYSSFPSTWFVYATTSNVFQTSFTYLSLEFLFPIEPYTHAIISYIICIYWLTTLTSSHVKWSKVKYLSRVWLFVTPWTIAHQVPLPMGILQARILEWVFISFSRGYSQPRDQTPDSHIVDRRFNLWSTRDPIESSRGLLFYLAREKYILLT